MAKQQNTPGFGTEYEIFVSAFVALKLNNDAGIEDFTVRSNVEKEFGNLDDLVVDIKTTNNTRQHFAIQLKHKDKNDGAKIIPPHFDSRDAFSLEKYCRAFKKVNDQIKTDYHFILYTNWEYNATSKEQSKKYRITEDQKCPGRTLFYNSRGADNTYKFELIDNTTNEGAVTEEDFKCFFAKFTAFVGQKNFKDFEEEVFRILKNRNAVLNYLDLFRRWHQGRFTNKTIDRKTLNLHLVDIFLSDFVITNQLSIHQNGNLELFEKVVREFDVTVINDLKENVTVDWIDCEDSGNLLTDRMKLLLEKYIEECKIDRQKLHDDPGGTLLQCMLFLGKNCKIVDRTTQQLDACSRKKILYYFFEELFYIDFNKLSEESVYRMFDLYQRTNSSIKFVLLGPGVDSSRFSKFTVFKDLKNLRDCDDSLHLEVLQKCQISMQSKDPITLEQLINSCGTSDFIGVKEILQMLRDDFIVGGENEILPVNYIPRKLSSNVLKLDTILKNDFVKNNMLISNFDGKFEQVRHKFEENSIKIIEIQDFVRLNGPPEEDVVISLVNECSMKQFREISEKFDPKSLLHLKMIDPETFVPVIFKTDDSKIFGKTSTEEEKVPEFFNNRINLLCAQPGMGKSTMFKVLKNKLSNVWTVMIDLKAHNAFLNTRLPIQEVLAHFLEPSQDDFLEKIKTAFLEQKKLIFFFDGLDELGNRCIDNILNYCEELSNLELQVWISSRPNLESKLTSRFCQSCIQIEEVTKEEQKVYIRNRLLPKYKEQEVRELTEKLFKNTHIEHNSRLLGIPLQLYMMTQIFLDDEDQYYAMTKNMFVLTKMYKMFFDGRYKHTSDKEDSKYPQLKIGVPEDHFEKYETIALQFLFDDDLFAKLNLDFRRSRRFLEEIRTKKDPLGVVVGINTENKAIFEHYTYAEYFACVFLANNFDRAQVFRDHLFSDRYRSLLLMLNVMLAEENPLHLAIIYEDLDQIEAYRDDPNIYDKGGRNPLHIAVTSGVKYPGCFSFSDSKWSFDQLRFYQMEYQMNKDLDVMKHLAIKFNPLDVDNLLKWNCLDYAFAGGCLHAVELILPKCEIPKDYFERCKHDPLFASFCTLTGSVNLLSITLGNASIPTMTHWLQKSLLHDTIMFGLLRKLEMLRLLLQKGVDVDSPYQDITALQLAVQRRNLEGVKLLLENGASTNVTTKDGDTLLHCISHILHFHSHDICLYEGPRCDDKFEATPSVLRETFNLVTVLLEKGVPINASNGKGETALHLAVQAGNLKVVQSLCKGGADINAVTKNSSNVLHYAAGNTNSELTTFLLNETRFDINTRNDDGVIPLLKAVYNGNLKIVSLLLDKGADVNFQTNDGLTLLNWAVHTCGYSGNDFGDYATIAHALGRRTAVKIRTAFGTEDWTPLLMACQKLPLIGLLLEKGADVNILTGEGVHCLQLAVYSGYVEIVEMILDRVDLEQVVWTSEKYSLAEAERNGVLQSDLLLQLTKSVFKKNVMFVF